MKNKREFCNKHLSLGVELFVVLILLCSCAERTNSNFTASKSIEQDSVSSWINESQDDSNTLTDRQLFLQKAYDNVISRKVDTNTLKQLGRIQWTFMSLGDSLQFRQSNSKTRTFSLALNDSIRLGISHWDLGVFLNNKSLKDSAFYHLARAQTIFSILGDDEKTGEILYEIAALQLRIKDYVGSESSVIGAVKLLKPLNKNASLYHCYNLLGIIAKDMSDFDRALEQYGIANEYLNKLNESTARKNIQLQIFNNIGNVYLEMGNLEKAQSFYKKALLDNGIKSSIPGFYARALNNLAYCNYKLGETKEVEKQFKLALRIRDSLNDYEGISGSNYSLAEYYLSLEDSLKAKSYAMAAINNAELSNNNYRLLETLALFTKIDPKNSAGRSQQYFVLNDSLQRLERSIRDKFARIEFETEEVEAENIVLARQKQIWTGIAVGALLLAISVFIIISQRIRNQKLRFEQEQQEANNEIFSLMLSQKQKIEEGKKSEQRRISEELHDGVLGEMNGARMVLMGLNHKSDENAIAMRSTAIAKLQEVQEEIRTISHELSDAAYQKFHNFIISIQELLSSVSETATFDHTLVYNEEFDWDNLSAEIKINVYRIVQESLMNCVKHAQAKTVELNFENRGNTLLVRLSDDGKGFNINKGKKGIGHKNISSRVEKLNGNWGVVSEIGNGTVVTIEIPLKFSHSEIKEELVVADK